MATEHFRLIEGAHSMGSVSKLTQSYIRNHPSVRDAIIDGIVNYSALARQICSEYQLDSFDAVQIACRRFSTQVKKSGSNERKIIGLMKSSRLNIRSKMIVATAVKPKNYEQIDKLQNEIRRSKGDLNIIEGESALTIITNSEYESEIRRYLRGKILRVTGSLAQVTMIFNEDIERVPGVVSYVYSVLYKNGINICEEMSCWTDLMFMIKEQDLSKALSLLGGNV